MRRLQNLKKSSTQNLTLLSSVKFLVEDFFKLCGLLRISELYRVICRTRTFLKNFYRVQEKRSPWLSQEILLKVFRKKNGRIKSFPKVSHVKTFTNYEVSFIFLRFYNFRSFSKLFSYISLMY